MKELISEPAPFVRLHSDFETRLFLLQLQPELPVKYSQNNSKGILRATWEGLTKSEAYRIEHLIRVLRSEHYQSQYN